MLTAWGGILYIIFQDITPQSRLEKQWLERHWLPPVGGPVGVSILPASEMMLRHFAARDRRP